MSARRFGYTTLCLLATGLLAACGGGEPAPAGAGGGGEKAAASQAAGACELVSESDASALFGQPASLDSGPGAVTMIDQCLWTWDTDTSSQLLQFHIWDPRAYSPPEDSTPLDLGEGGYIRSHPVAGVDIGWIQGGRMISLAYSTVGPDAPAAPSRAEQLTALARQVADRL
jgi:hypothetical protein